MPSKGSGVVRLDSSRLGSAKPLKRGLLPLRGGTVKNTASGSRARKSGGWLLANLTVSVPFLNPAVMSGNGVRAAAGTASSSATADRTETWLLMLNKVVMADMSSNGAPISPRTGMMRGASLDRNKSCTRSAACPRERDFFRRLCA